MGVSLSVETERMLQKLTRSGIELDKFHDLAQIYKEKVGLKTVKNATNLKSWMHETHEKQLGGIFKYCFLSLW